MSVTGYCEAIKSIKVIDGNYLPLYCTLPKDHDGMHRAAYHWSQEIEDNDDD